jgi:hypothetical protein
MAVHDEWEGERVDVAKGKRGRDKNQKSEIELNEEYLAHRISESKLKGRDELRRELTCRARLGME